MMRKKIIKVVSSLFFTGFIFCVLSLNVYAQGVEENSPLLYEVGTYNTKTESFQKELQGDVEGMGTIRALAPNESSMPFAPLLSVPGGLDPARAGVFGIVFGIIFIGIPLLIAQIFLLVGIFRKPKHLPGYQAFIRGWGGFRQRMRFFVLFALTQIASSLILAALLFIIKSWVLIACVIVIFSLIYVYSMSVLVSVILSVLDNNKIHIFESIKDVKRHAYFILANSVNGIALFLPLVCALVLTSLIRAFIIFYAGGTPIGVSILITVSLWIIALVCTMIFGLRFSFSPILTQDRMINPLHALMESWKMTKGIKGELMLFWYLLMCINILGFFVLFGVGALFTIPLTLCIASALYRSLLPQETKQSPEAKESNKKVLANKATQKMKAV
ncbi:MAG: hypothetical protein Q7R79_03220 [bacterium]|nr:hypothetical protein [bacterium]